jgi:hypothetical protein
MFVGGIYRTDSMNSNKQGPFINLSNDTRGLSTHGSASFTSAFAFGAPVIDPFLTAIHFISVVLEHHIFSNESAIKVAQRGARMILGHSSVYVANNSAFYCLQDATIRFRPNGEEIRCHGQPARYIRKTRVAGNEVVVFRCSQPEHEADGSHGRKFVVTLPHLSVYYSRYYRV